MGDTAPRDPYAPPQRERLSRFGAEQCVDIHCHCLPCLDDGPGTLVEALGLCRALVADGITTAVATPHQLGRYHGRNTAAEVRAAVEGLNRSLMSEGIPLAVLPGADVRVDEQIPRMLAGGQVLTLGDRGKVLLLELPHDVFIDPLPLVRRLSEQGVRSIISHPERNRFLTSSPHVIRPWLEAGAVLQITSGSFAGDFGSTAQRAAWYWLETGQASLVASDAHDLSRRPPRMTEAIRLISRRLGEQTARRVCVENPAKIVADQELARPVRSADSVA